MNRIHLRVLSRSDSHPRKRRADGAGHAERRGDGRGEHQRGRQLLGQIRGQKPSMAMNAASSDRKMSAQAPQRLVLVGALELRFAMRLPPLLRMPAGRQARGTRRRTGCRPRCRQTTSCPPDRLPRRAQGVHHEAVQHRRADAHGKRHPHGPDAQRQAALLRLEPGRDGGSARHAHDAHACALEHAAGHEDRDVGRHRSHDRADDSRKRWRPSRRCGCRTC